MSIYYKGMGNGDKKIMSKLYKPMVIILLTICALTLTLILSIKINVPIAPMIQKEIIYRYNEECDYMTKLTDDVMRRNLDFITIKKQSPFEYLIVRGFDNGKVVKYTHKWE